MKTTNKQRTIAERLKANDEKNRHTSASPNSLESSYGLRNYEGWESTVASTSPERPWVDVPVFEWAAPPGWDELNKKAIRVMESRLSTSTRTALPIFHESEKSGDDNTPFVAVSYTPSQKKEHLMPIHWVVLGGSITMMLLFFIFL